LKTKKIIKLYLTLPSYQIHMIDRTVTSWKQQLRTKIWYFLCTKQQVRHQWSVYFNPAKGFKFSYSQ